MSPSIIGSGGSTTGCSGGISSDSSTEATSAQSSLGEISSDSSDSMSEATSAHSLRGGGEASFFSPSLTLPFRCG